MSIGVETVASLLGLFPATGRIDYTPYDFRDVSVLFGAPIVELRGLDYVLARHNAPQTKRFQCLRGGGVFVSNVNSSGIIEIGVMGGSVSQGQIELMQATGIPYPVIIQDKSSGGSSQVIATACQLVQTPEWKRAAVPETVVYTFETTRLFVAHGVRLPYLVI